MKNTSRQAPTLRPRNVRYVEGIWVYPPRTRTARFFFKLETRIRRRVRRTAALTMRMWRSYVRLSVRIARKSWRYIASTRAMKATIKFLDTDVLLAAILVIPSTSAWIASERLWVAFIVAILMYAAYEIGLPSLRDRRLNLDRVHFAFESARTSLLSRFQRTVRA